MLTTLRQLYYNPTMLYLLYLRSGFIKKFPLDMKTIHLGRAQDNNFCLNESFVSKKHAKIHVFKEHIVVEDLNSTNGIYMGPTKIDRAPVKLNQCFRIGYINFFLKKGNPKEFVISEKVQPVLSKISNVLSAGADETQEAVRLLYSQPLIEMLQIGFSLHDSIDLFKYARELLDDTLRDGCLLLISKEKKSIKIESKWNYSEKYLPLINRVLLTGDLFQKASTNCRPIDSFHFCSFPVNKTPQQLVLLYLAHTDVPIHEITLAFLEDLAVEISLIAALIEQNRAVEAEEGKEHILEIITINRDMLNLLSKGKKIAASHLFVLIEGETGTGKELLAKFIHSKSKRSTGNFVALNCAAIPENLMEDELFGHEKGAFTDAKTRRAGKLELSSGGTLVLDEIGDMPLSLQKKLLRVIQEGQFFRLGGNQPIKVDLRIISLTHKNIKEQLLKNQFREDLYYRIAHVSLKVPPLRNRKEDIASLVNYFSEVFSKETQIYIKGFSEEAIKAMEKYDWPGNIRELENEVKKVIAISESGDVIDLDQLKDEITSPYEDNIPHEPFAGVIVGDDEDEKERLLALLAKHKWNKTQVSNELNISRPTLYEKLKKYNIES